MKIMGQRQVSACECVYRLCHLKLTHSARTVVFLNTRKPEQRRYRILKFDEAGPGAIVLIFLIGKKKCPVTHSDYDFS